MFNDFHPKKTEIIKILYKINTMIKLSRIALPILELITQRDSSLAFYDVASTCLLFI